jgi:hypothetical protein
LEQFILDHKSLKGFSPGFCPACSCGRSVDAVKRCILDLLQIAGKRALKK